MMRILFAVLCLFVAYAVSYPSLRQMDASDDDDENSKDFQLELRSILKLLSNSDEQMERSVASDEDSSSDDNDSMNKRQGGYNTVSPGLKCEIECVGKLRKPETGDGMSIKDATKACKNICGTKK